MAHWIESACDDGNPCTMDVCEVGKGCTSKPDDGAACTTSSALCPTGTCAAGACTAKPGIVCKTQVTQELCGSIEVTGVCTAAAKCTDFQVAGGFTCAGCKTLCVKCLGISVCLDAMMP
ncbi:MAG: hypothetical protein H6747_12375 [Deltaproteobacteria bacterium]|nr:hypothetical protein [Deltaproteobacteria bacterium]